MLPLERHRLIVELLGQHGVMRVNEIAQATRVSRETIRRDLSELERKGILTRSHGGALAAENPLPATRAAASALPVEIPEMLAKITQLHQLKETGSLRFLLEVDGSCNRNTYRALLGAGAQILVMGSSGLFRADMPLELAWETMSRELSAALHSPELV